MTNAQSPERYIGTTAVDTSGNKIGTVGQVYLNDDTGEPDWITVNTGLFGTKENFAPLAGATFTGDDLVLPFDKAVVKDAPHVEDSSHLDADEQEELYRYYQQYLSGGTSGYSGRQSSVGTEGTYAGTESTYAGTEGTSGTYAGTEGTAGTYAGTEETAGTYAASGTRSEGYDTSGPTTDDAMTRSEEHLNVGTQRVEAGRARLRKYVVTEQQTVNVPVSREEVTVEREPITEENRGAALDGPAISEEEHEVVLHAEQPVVQTEAVPVERVRLGTETVTEQQNVTGEVRKEQIEVEDGAESSRGTYSDNR